MSFEVLTLLAGCLQAIVSHMFLILVLSGLCALITWLIGSSRNPQRIYFISTDKNTASIAVFCIALFVLIILFGGFAWFFPSKPQELQPAGLVTFR